MQALIKDIKSDGSIFLKLNSMTEKIAIKQAFLFGALEGDLVKVKITNRKRYGISDGKVTEIIKRGSDHFTARVEIKDKLKFAILYPYQSKKIIINDSLNDLKDNDVIELKVTSWNDYFNPAKGEIIKLINRATDFEADYNYIIKKYKLFNKSQNNYKKKDLTKIFKIQRKRRKDLSKLETFTIDPKNAKDFDDAISITKEDDIYSLFVHIADVSEFVKEGDSNDLTAQTKGNSYYFPEGTIHMLPKYIATNLGSLLAHKKRLALTLKLHINKTGNVLTYEFFESTIECKKNFSYEAVERIFKGEINSSFQKSLDNLNELCLILKRNRYKIGGIALHSRDIKFKLDSYGNPIDIQLKRKLKSHYIIEEIMLLANKTAASELIKLGSPDCSFSIFRNHDIPSKKSENFINNIARNFKIHSMDEGTTLNYNKLNESLKKINSEQEKYIISQLILKKLKKARYQVSNRGHFGTGFKHYTHFTSPIRRYSDLTVHRILKQKFKSQNPLENEKLIKIVEFCNDGEKRANDAEREYFKLKCMKWIKSKKRVKGNIVGFTEKSIEVAEMQTQFIGHVNYDSLDKNIYKISKDRLKLSISKGKYILKVGQKVSLITKSISIHSKEIYFYIENNLIEK